MNKYYDILSSFGTHETLNPEIWDNVDTDTPKLKPNIRKALLMIAGEFMDYLSEDLFVDDVRFTGSLANFNWSKYSDIDLHLHVDFGQFDDEDSELYKELYKLKKTMFNDTHNITVKGYDVELYAEDIAQPHISTGVYSVLFDEWVEKPERENVKIDKELLKRKSQDMMDKIDNLIKDVNEGDYDESLKKIDEFKDKIKKIRQSGLEKDGEFSYENLVFKVLRRNGYLDKLWNFENNWVDKKLSVDENKPK